MTFGKIGARNPLARILPYDAEVEYLQNESQVNRYIDTGKVFDPTLDFEVAVRCAVLTTNRTIVCGSYEGNSTAFNIEFGGTQNYNPLKPRGYIARPNLVFDVYGDAVVKESVHDITLYYVASSSLGSLAVDGMITQSGTVPFNNGPVSKTLLLFKDWRGNLNEVNPIRIYSVCIYRGGTLVRDFQPVRFTNELGQTEGAMYDRANPTVGMNPDGSARDDGLYRNRGSDAFVIGTDK